MIEIGSLKTSAGVEIVDAEIGALSACALTNCMGGDRIFGDVPVSKDLLADSSRWEDQTFSVTSYVLSADASH